MSINLDSKVRAELMARKGDWQAVAAGAEVSYSWLSKFANGHIDNPGYATLVRLSQYLKSSKRPKVSSRPAEEAQEV